MDLRRQYQAFSHCPEKGELGDCWRTAVACVLEIERDLVPHFKKEMNPLEWRVHSDWVLRKFGVRQIDVPFSAPEDSSVRFEDLIKWAWDVGGGQPYVLSGCTPRGFNHAIAVIGPKDFHDPNPVGKGLSAPCQPDGYYWASYLVPIETAQVVAQRVVRAIRTDDLL